MKIATTIAGTREAVGRARSEGRLIGLVPTMGALHAGHRALARRARGECGFVVVSVFVNPAQFGRGEDFEGYPRTREADLAACEADGVDLVFRPGVEEMYQGRRLTSVRVRELTDGLCGASRPGHFDGVTTVVAKLFHIVQPGRAYFGEKDYQQLVIIERMVRDLNVPVEIVRCPTVREDDGLAVSSRNAYLDADRRKQAPVLLRAMIRASDSITAGSIATADLIEGIEADLRGSGPLEIDYAVIVDAATLQPVDRVAGSCRICLAVTMGRCRLIDNLAVDVPKPSR